MRDEAGTAGWWALSMQTLRRRWAGVVTHRAVEKEHFKEQQDMIELHFIKDHPDYTVENVLEESKEKRTGRSYCVEYMRMDTVHWVWAEWQF